MESGRGDGESGGAEERRSKTAEEKKTTRGKCHDERRESEREGLEIKVGRGKMEKRRRKRK